MFVFFTTGHFHKRSLLCKEYSQYYFPFKFLAQFSATVSSFMGIANLAVPLYILYNFAHTYAEMHRYNSRILAHINYRKQSLMVTFGRRREQHGRGHLSDQSGLRVHHLLDVRRVLAAAVRHHHRLRSHLLDRAAPTAPQNPPAVDRAAAAAAPCLPVADADPRPSHLSAAARRRSAVAGGRR